MRAAGAAMLTAATLMAAVLVSGLPARADTATDAPVYGQTVQTPESLPAAPSIRPGTLPSRPETGLSIDGSYKAPFSGAMRGQYLLFYTGQYVTITGKGYFDVAWEVGWGNYRGELVMPRFINTTGSLFHVASGGGHRMDDLRPDTPGQDPTTTWMGTANYHDTLPAGTAVPWQDEYYYIDGSVTFMNAGNAVDYNVSVTPVSRDYVEYDVNRSNNNAFVRYGVIRDDGTDRAEVPQYATRSALLGQSIAAIRAGAPVNSDLTSLSPPRSVTATSSAAGLGLSWTTPLSTGGAMLTGYEVSRSTDGTNWSDPVAVTGLSAALDGLTPSTTYHVRVRALTAATAGPWSGIASATTAASTQSLPVAVAPTTSTAVTGLTVIPADGSVRVSWTRTGAAGYAVQRRVGSGAWDAVATTSDASVTDAALDNGATYQYRVAAVDATGSAGTWTDVASATPFDFTPAMTDVAGTGVADRTLSRGAAVVLSGSRMPPGSTVTLVLHSTPVVLGSATVAADGTYRLATTIPASAASGAHRLIATASGTGAAEVSSTVGIRVAASSVALASTGVAPTVVPGVACILLGTGLVLSRRILRRRPLARHRAPAA